MFSRDGILGGIINRDGGLVDIVSTDGILGGHGQLRWYTGWNH